MQMQYTTAAMQAPVYGLSPGQTNQQQFQLTANTLGSDGTLSSHVKYDSTLSHLSFFFGIVSLDCDDEDYLTKKFNLMINEAKTNPLQMTTDVAIRF